MKGRERIVIELDVGANAYLWTQALQTARDFASVVAFRANTGMTHCVTYGLATGEYLAAYWTPSRSVVVRQVHTGSRKAP